MTTIRELLQEPLLLIIVILFVGSLLGEISYKGLRIGSSGILLVGMLFGHLGYEVPAVVQNIGLSTFITAVGLQAGPRFFKMMKSSGIVFGILGIVIVFVGVIATFIVTKLFHFSPALGVGLMTGALSSTPGLAAALEATGDPIVSVAYGIAYPFGVIAVVLFVQFISKIVKVDLEEELKIRMGPRRHKGSPESIIIRVENDDFHKKTLNELKLNKNNSVVISRVIRGDRSFLGRNDTVILKGDELICVGFRDDLENLVEKIGSIVEKTRDYGSYLSIRKITVDSDELIGKNLRELDLRSKFGVNVTRMERGGFEFHQNPSWRLERGDVLTVVGSDRRLNEVEKLFGARQLAETNVHILSLSLILLVGVVLGMVPIYIPGLGSITLGLAGGPLFIAILIGHFGKIGPIKARFFQPATRVIRDLGLALFLAGAGTTAGKGLVDVLQTEGFKLLIGGAIITILPIIVGFFFARKVFKLSYIHSLGGLCGGITSTPGLGVCNNLVNTDDATIAYAAAYPFGLVCVAVSAQLLPLIL